MSTDYQQETSLHDWVCNSGQGIMGLNGSTDVPLEMVEFAITQYQRFGIPVPPNDVIREACWATIFVIDNIDPYTMLCGLSDVEVSQAWSEMYFEIVDNRGHGTPASPEQLETFIYIPGKDQTMFNEMLSRPGLKAVPYCIGNGIEDVLRGEYYGDDGYGIGTIEALNDDSKEWLRRTCANDETKILAYFELAAWSALLWILGPLGREFRYTHHHVFNYAASNGEAVMYEGYVLDKEHYRKFAKSPESCVECGIKKYCVELSYIAGHTRFICEHHMNGPAMYEQATCGSRICRAVDCVNHPMYGQDGGLMNTMRKTGQLMGHNKQQSIAIGDSSKILLTN